MKARPLAVSVGDAGGVGPTVSLRAALALRHEEHVVLFGDRAQLDSLAASEGAQDLLRTADLGPSMAHEPGTVGVVDTGEIDPALIARHADTPELGRAQLHTLRSAAQSVLDGFCRGLVTGPTSKAAIVAGGHPFTGQTELLAGLCGLDDDQVTMLFLGPALRVALVTTHLAVRDVPTAITASRVQRSARHLAEALVQLEPARETLQIGVVGLNPHAGEGGLFGREELDTIHPALGPLEAGPPFSGGRVRLVGPAPAEAVFRAAQRRELDGVVAMFHDQATIASKLLDWGAAVNVTWGLPFVRTSVDHGVAFEAARSGRIEHAGMLAAIVLAQRLTPHADG